MFPRHRNENRNEGTFACSPGTKTGTRVRLHVPLGRKPGTRAHPPKPPFYETALLSPGDESQRQSPFASDFSDRKEIAHLGPKKSRFCKGAVIIATATAENRAILLDSGLEQSPSKSMSSLSCRASKAGVGWKLRTEAPSPIMEEKVGTDQKSCRRQLRMLHPLSLGVFQRPLTLILLQKYRDTNGSRIVIQIGGVYTTFCQKGGHTFQKYQG